ncbi:hypothetical protein [Parerythrobacter lacustris]|uniref:Uncharacterized protein n=1 Tax=Parerythrobacter lacustris TaxID=2969984 RepID=A0ABT1XR63_9SPHN|nr:hypothetical protein [Parerythrobacter lacustris]MCR2834148.1 hypothetical protein [Parerythrobacter lacustris]
MRYLSAIGLAAAIPLAGCGAGVTEDNLASRLEGAAKFLNTDGQAMLADTMDGAKLTATAEGGDTLVMTIENVPTGNEIFDPGTMRKLLRPNVCDEAGNRSVIDAGGKFRIEMISNTGKVQSPVTIANC